MRLSTALLVFCLFLFPVTAVACSPAGSESVDSSAPTDVPPEAQAEELTARQVLVLAQTALESEGSYRGFGVTRIEVDGQEPEVSTLTVEWASPDRLRQESRTADPNGVRQESIESIKIGEEQYLRGSYRDGRASTSASWHQGPSYPGPANPVKSSLAVTGPIITGTVSLNGREAYRIEGTAQAMIDPVPAIGTLPVSGRLTLFVDAANFQLVRVEQIAEVTGYSPRPGLGIVPRFVLESGSIDFTATTSLDIEYFDEPIALERPVVFPTPTRRRR